MQVDLDIVANNYANALGDIDGRQFIAVVKGDAYGIGALPVAKRLSSEGCSQFAVASLDEGIALRKGGITEATLILGYTDPKKLFLLKRYDLTQAVFSYNYYQKLLKARTRTPHNGKKVKIQIKIDSGMNRLGFNICDESLVEIEKIANDLRCDVQGIFSHFACSDDDTPLGIRRTLNQKKSFCDFVTQLNDMGIAFRNVHIAASRGVKKDNADICNSVRIGAGLYGINAYKDVATERFCTKEVSDLWCRIAQIKIVKKGNYIGYGSETIAQDDMKIAIVTIGYADGYPRSLSKIGHMEIEGVRAKIVGKICMDMCILDVTDVPAMEGGAVLVWGKSSSTSLAKYAILAKTIDYELLCGLSPRVKRVYKSLTKNDV